MRSVEQPWVPLDPAVIGEHVRHSWFRAYPGGRPPFAVDLGVHVLELPDLLEVRAEVVVVDASRGNEPVGRVAVRRAEEILQSEAGGTISHAADLRFALRLAQAELGVLPPTHVVTVAVPAIRVFQTRLSPAVERVVPRIVAKIAHLLQIRNHP